MERRNRGKMVVGMLLMGAAGAAVWQFGRGREKERYFVPPSAPGTVSKAIESPSAPEALALIEHLQTAADKIVNGAKLEAQKGAFYDARYVRIAYPGGDVRSDRGACTDVIIRALRHAGYDLQALIHEDMTRHFSLYPQRYGLHRPDASIDHRRTPNQMTFFRRFGTEFPTETTGDAKATWQPGDFIYWDLPSGTGHCGVLSNVRNADGLPLVIHNLSRTAQEDCLTAWKITGHFRYPGR